MGGAVGILSNGLRLLHRLGVYDTLLEKGSSRSNVVIHSTKGAILGTHDMGGYARAQTGFGYMRIKRTDLMNVLLDAVHKAEIPVHFGKRLVAINDEQDGVSVTFSDGTTDPAEVLLGCDGIHSQVRRLYVDPGRVPEYTGFAGLSSIIPTSRLPHYAKAQLSGFDVTVTEKGMVAAMLCTSAGDEVFWGFSGQVEYPDSDFEDSRDGWDEVRKDQVDGFKSWFHKILANLDGVWSGTMRHIVEGTDVVKFYPNYKLPPGGSWSSGRCILLGDAAHAMPPHAGQGVSMALEDAFFISRLLECPTRSQGVFDRFDQARRPRVEEMYRLAARNAEHRKKTGPWGLWVKELVIWMALWTSWAVGMEMWGFGQKHLLYDIDKEEL